MDPIEDLKERAGLQAEVPRIFFAGMKRGYVNGIRSGLAAYAIHGIQSSRGHTFYDRGGAEELTGWTLQDNYMVGRGGASSGMTVIAYNEQPIWHMQYWGCYAEEVTPFLKAALATNYEKSVFFGGRGPENFTDKRFPGHIYLNGTTDTEGFAKFSGREGIRLRVNDQFKSAGWHQYQGGLLI